MTNGLSNYFMPVHEKHIGQERVELFFCLPSYWDMDDDSPNFQWPVKWLTKLAIHAKEKETWFGVGHTIQCNKDFSPISENMKQTHFLLNRPQITEETMPTLKHPEGGEIQWLAVLPIFSDEMDYKQGKGTLKLLKKLEAKNINEKLDDYRYSVLKSRFSLFSKRSK